MGCGLRATAVTLTALFLGSVSAGAASLQNYGIGCDRGRRRREHTTWSQLAQS